jgi:hypothetical protein
MTCMHDECGVHTRTAATFTIVFKKKVINNQGTLSCLHFHTRVATMQNNDDRARWKKQQLLVVSWLIHFPRAVLLQTFNSCIVSWDLLWQCVMMIQLFAAIAIAIIGSFINKQAFQFPTISNYSKHQMVWYNFFLVILLCLADSYCGSSRSVLLLSWLSPPHLPSSLKNGLVPLTSSFLQATAATTKDESLNDQCAWQWWPTCWWKCTTLQLLLLQE